MVLGEKNKFSRGCHSVDEYWRELIRNSKSHGTSMSGSASLGSHYFRSFKRGCASILPADVQTNTDYDQEKLQHFAVVGLSSA